VEVEEEEEVIEAAAGDTQLHSQSFFQLAVDF
jgi:hypothetical protein